MKKLILATIGFGLFVVSCTDNFTPTAPTEQAKPTLPESPYVYSKLNLPEGSRVAGTGQVFDDLGNPIETIHVTDHGATLGRVLFYDKQLSLNNSVSCGTCHHQSKSFADGLAGSKGFEGKVTTRNSMAIVNPITQNNLFWDSRSKTLKDLALKPVQNHVEMGMENIDNLVAKIQKIDYYKPLLTKAYGSDQVTAEKLSDALSQFIGSITSNRSKLDIAEDTNFGNFSDLEKMGHAIFNSDKAKCSSCHGGATMAAQDGPNDPYGGGGGGNIFGSGQDRKGATNIGLDLQYADQGVGEGNFKIPTLRNVGLTAPYMHDGRFETLDQVVEHYSSGIKPHKHLDPKFKDVNGHVKKLDLSSVEKKALVAFLHTLTDHEMIKDPKWSDPFKR
jgi:cytochrome c peroxidase